MPATWWGYLGLAAVLSLAAAVTAPLPSSVFRILMAGLATLAMIYGIRRYRPDLQAGWWMITAGAGAGILALAITVASMAATGDASPDEWAYSVLAALQFPLFIAGLVVLSRLGQAGGAGLLDAAVIALATFLVLFSLVIRPVLPGGPFALATAVAFPLGALLLFAMIIRVAFSVGVPTIALGLLLLALCARVASTVSMLVPALNTGSLQISVATRPLSAASYILLGAAALHPSLASTRHRRRYGDDTISLARVAMLGLIAIVVPLVLLLDIRLSGGATAATITVPVLAAATLLLLLVGRLGLTASAAQRRAAELAQRSDDLAEAAREQESLQQQLRYQSMHDPTTGLANRIVLNERLEWALARPYGSRRHALVMFDIDRFKEVNDTLGRPAGDDVLVEVARRLVTSAARGTAVVARLSGDEFAVLLEDTTATAARQWADHAREILHRPYRIAGQELRLNTSVGLLTIGPEQPARNASEALRDTDLALHAAKSRGRNQVTVFQPELRSEQLNTSRLSTGLRNALANRELVLHYQPVVDLRTDRPVGVEALLRWERPGLPPVPPSEFIPVAEDIGVIGAIGDWVIEQACRDAHQWHRRYGISVAVNVSARQLADPDFADRVLATVEQSGLPGHALTLEITESTLATTSASVMSQLERLRAHQIRLAIDDFGTGYSSLAYVARLPVDIVKLDRSFLPQIGDSEARGWEFARAVLQMMTALHLPVVAEGVERLEQAEALRDLHCDMAQGYFFGKPMPANLLLETLPRLGPPPDPGHPDGSARDSGPDRTELSRAAAPAHRRTAGGHSPG